MIDKIDHAALVVSDIDRSVDFYTRILGFKIVRQLKFADRELVILGLGEGQSAKLEILRYDATDLRNQVPDDRTLLGLRHLAFHVQDLKATYDKLIEVGVEMQGDPPFLRPGGPPIAFGFDPDRVLLEFTEID
jgi:catechol 2,3-dioxygenase-like lactoylglutathione lyase family enzyme